MRNNIILYNKIAKLNSFQTLEENWDGEGALKPSLLAIEFAKSFVSDAYSFGLEVYFIAPGPMGEILVEFKGKAGNTVEVFFEADSEKRMVLYNSEDDIVFTGPIALVDLASHLNQI